MREASGMRQVIQDTSKYLICALGNVNYTVNRKHAYKFVSKWPKFEMFPLVQLCFQICELNNKAHLKIHECPLWGLLCD